MAYRSDLDAAHARIAFLERDNARLCNEVRAARLAKPRAVAAAKSRRDSWVLAGFAVALCCFVIPMWLIMPHRVPATPTPERPQLPTLYEQLQACAQTAVDTHAAATCASDLPRLNRLLVVGQPSLGTWAHAEEQLARALQDRDVAIAAWRSAQ